MCRVLDRAAEEHWQRHGWLWLRGFLGDEAARDLGVWTDEIAAWPEVPGRWMRYYERRGGDAAAKMLARIENFVPYHERLAALFTGPRVLGLLADCAGETVVLFKDKINFKLPGGAGFAPHQDAPAYVDFGIDQVECLERAVCHGGMCGKAAPDAARLKTEAGHVSISSCIV